MSTTSLSVQLITVAIVTLQRQVNHNYYGLTSTPANGTMYDYIVVGAGSAGCVVASRLAQNSSINVLLLEAGGPQSVITDMPGNTMFLIGGEFDWNYHVVPQTSAGLAYPDFSVSRGKILGGSSVTNWGIYNRGNRRDYDNWALTYNLTEWSYQYVLPYFLLSENNTDPRVNNRAYHRTGGPISISTESMPDPVLVGFRDAVSQIGIPILDINGENQFGTTIAQMMWNSDNGIKSTTANAYIEAYNRTNLHVLTRAHVHRVLVDTSMPNNTQAYGVIYRREGLENLVSFASREVIVSAGAINSPQILMLSGIGPREHLESLNITVVADLPVGDNLHDHVFVPLYYRIENRSLIDPMPTFDIENLYEYYTYASGPLGHHPDGVTYLNTRYNIRDSSWPDSMVIAIVEYFGSDLNATVSQYINNTDLWTDFWRDYVNGYYLALDPVLARPLSRGTVRLNSTDPFDPPLIDPRYLSEEQDFETILDAVRITMYITLRYPLLNVVMFPPIPGCQLCNNKYLCDDYLRCHIRQLARSYYDFVGTCRMGNTADNNSVVDERLRVRGVSNLRVVDASVIPEIPNAHTNAVTIMIAERAADFIKSDE